MLLRYYKSRANQSCWTPHGCIVVPRQPTPLLLLLGWRWPTQMVMVVVTGQWLSGVRRSGSHSSPRHQSWLSVLCRCASKAAVSVEYESPLCLRVLCVIPPLRCLRFISRHSIASSASSNFHCHFRPPKTLLKHAEVGCIHHNTARTEHRTRVLLLPGISTSLDSTPTKFNQIGLQLCQARMQFDDHPLSG